MTRLRRLLGVDGASRREVHLLLAAMALGLAIRLAYVYVTRDHALAGDEPQYDAMGKLATEGHWLWSTTPYGDPHPSAWKTPVYPLWMGLWYTVLGAEYDRVLAVQAFLGPITIGLTWLLARRLVGARWALVAAFVVALYPNAWQVEVRLFPDGLATVLTLLVLLSFLGLEPTGRRAVVTGLLLGLTMLTRPSSVLLAGGIALAYWTTVGARRGTAHLAITAAATVLVIAPWTIRNAVVIDGFVPLSIQDAAISGTFNDTSANDPVYPYAWRPLPERDRDIAAEPRSEIELYHELRRRAREYISEHPESVPEAFFWNGLSRLWDIRRPARVLDDVPFEGRTRSVAVAGLAVYWPLLLLALAGLWRNRRRRAIVLPVLAIALAASVVFTAASGTRYRATLEPLIVIMACSAFAPISPRPART